MPEPDKGIAQLEAYVNEQKGVYDEDYYQNLVQAVDDLGEYLEEEDLGGIFVAAMLLEDAAEMLKTHAKEHWGMAKTVEVLKEQARESAQTQEETNE